MIETLKIGAIYRSNAKTYLSTLPGSGAGSIIVPDLDPFMVVANLGYDALLVTAHGMGWWWYDSEKLKRRCVEEITKS